MLEERRIDKPVPIETILEWKQISIFETVFVKLSGEEIGRAREQMRSPLSEQA